MIPQLNFFSEMVFLSFTLPPYTCNNALFFAVDIHHLLILSDRCIGEGRLRRTLPHITQKTTLSRPPLSNVLYDLSHKYFTQTVHFYAAIEPSTHEAGLTKQLMLEPPLPPFLSSLRKAAAARTVPTARISHCYTLRCLRSSKREGRCQPKHRRRQS